MPTSADADGAAVFGEHGRGCLIFNGAAEVVWVQDVVRNIGSDARVVSLTVNFTRGVDAGADQHHAVFQGTTITEGFGLVGINQDFLIFVQQCLQAEQFQGHVPGGGQIDVASASSDQSHRHVVDGDRRCQGICYQQLLFGVGTPIGKAQCEVAFVRRNKA